MESVRIRSGWVTFAAVIAGIVGVFNLLSGIAAIAEDDRTEALNEEFSEDNSRRSAPR